MRSVEVHIDELVLDGFDPGDGAAMSDAIGAEFARRVESGEIPAAIEPGAVAQQVVSGIETGSTE